MTYENINTTVLNLLMKLDLEVINLLESADAEAIEKLKAEPPFWVETMNIDLDVFTEEALEFDFD
mgnify:CR=1 FL=1